MTLPTRDRAREERAADFVRRFSAFWAAPAVERLDALLAEQVRLVAPMTRTTHTLVDGKRSFGALLGLIPDLTAEVHQWGETESGVLIDFTLSGTAAAAPLSWHAVDRIAVGEDGLATERVSYFDSMPLLLTVARHPRAGLAFLRSRLRG